MQLDFQKIEAEPAQFTDLVEDFFKQGGIGMNVTAPFKAMAFNLSDDASERAKATKVASFLVYKDNKILANNADGISIVRDITHNLHYPLTNKNILILGAGGAAQGILPDIAAEKPASIIIANRHKEKAQLLSKALRSQLYITACTYDELQNKTVDVVLDATSCWQSALPIPPSLKLSNNALCYDLKYSKEPTLFIQWAAKRNAKHIADGIGMLIEHNAIAFQCWTEKKPDTKPVITLAKTAFF